MQTYRVIHDRAEVALSRPSVSGTADLVFADSPYNIGIAYGDSPPSADRLEPRVFEQYLREWIRAMFVASKGGGVVAFLISEEWADQVGAIMSTMGPRINRVIWRETFANYASAETKMTNEHRHLFIHRRIGAPPVFNNDAGVRIQSERQRIGDNRANPNGRIPGDVWNCPRLVGSHPWRVNWHNAQLHPAPLTRLVRMFTKPRGVVVDAFAGSGNLGVVCALEGRRFLGVEKDRGTAQEIRRRVSAAYRSPESVTPVDMASMDPPP